MKKQNANNKLAFNKAAVTELNAAQLQTVNGGTSQQLQSLFDYISLILNHSKDTMCGSDAN